MGVHDYSCFCHGDEGDQCLENHDECCYEWSNPGDDVDDILLNDEITDTHDSRGMGSSIAYLLSFNIKNGGGVLNTDIILKKIKSGDYKSITCTMDDYSWDEWGFDKTPGYYDVLSCESKLTGEYPYSIWPDKNEGRWNINICDDCYKCIISKSIPAEYLCSQYLKGICAKHNIDYSQITSKGALLEKIQKELEYLNH